MIKRIKWLSEWDDDLCMCPSQLKREFKHMGGRWTVLCRWRHDDPWEFYVWHGKEYSSWAFIGDGMTSYDSIEDIHRYCEKLLIKYIETSNEQG